MEPKMKGFIKDVGKELNKRGTTKVILHFNDGSKILEDTSVIAIKRAGNYFDVYESNEDKWIRYNGLNEAASVMYAFARDKANQACWWETL